MKKKVVMQLSSYSNFQSDNVKNSLSRTDIYNSAFESAIKHKTGDFLDDNLAGYMEFVSFMRWYPDLAYDLMNPENVNLLELDLDQRVALRMLVRNPDNYLCVIRGWAKTMLHIMGHYHIARYYPNSRLAITASTRESATSIWQSKHTEILEYFPSIADEIKSFSFTKDKGVVEFVNGSRID
jgi:ribonucleoside-diphosphate reductase alpha chain